MKPCECEHADHFDGGPNHPYGVGVEPGAMGLRPVKTLFGTFDLCWPCLALGHMLTLNGMLPAGHGKETK